MRRLGPRMVALAAIVLALLASGGASAEEPSAGALHAQAFEVVPDQDWPQPAEVDASAYILIDVDTGQVLAEHQADEQRAVASTIKALTALTAVERVDLDDTVTVGSEVLVDGSSASLSPGDTWTVEQLLEGLMARSGNDAAEALAVHVGGSLEEFLVLMREDAEELGLADPTLVSVSGLNDENQLTARDLAIIGQAALANDELSPFLRREEVTLPSMGTVPTRNQFILDDPDATGVKTGYTRAAGYSFIGSVERDGRHLLAVVLGTESDEARFAAANELIEHGFDAYESTSVDGTISYAVGGGHQRYTLESFDLAVPAGAGVSVQPQLLAHPSDESLMDVMVDDRLVLTAPAALVADDSDVDPSHAATDALAQAAASDVYTALRAATAAERLR